jgi:tetratricopeptide (TPR) repeat protein
MDCPNCGNSLDISSDIEYVKCEYCRSVVAVMSHTSELLSMTALSEMPEGSQKQIKALLATANIDLENGDYEEAYTAYEKVLSDQPSIWEAMVNQAICIFWMGRKDMKHMRKVNALLKKADMLSDKNGIIKRTRRDIAHNLAVIGSSAEMYGDQILWSLECFKISQSLVNSNEKRDQLIQNYSTECLDRIIDNLSRDMLKKKKNYDPPMSDINILFEFSGLVKEEAREFIKLALVLAKYKLEKYKKNKQNEEVRLCYEKAEAMHAEICPGEPLPKLVFPRKKKPRLEISGG